MILSKHYLWIKYWTATAHMSETVRLKVGSLSLVERENRHAGENRLSFGQTKTNDLMFQKTLKNRTKKFNDSF